MIPNPEFQQKPKHFWAYVRILSQHFGYTVRGKRVVKVPALSEMRTGLSGLGLNPNKVVSASGYPTQLGTGLDSYFHHRAEVLNDSVQRQLMVVEEAQQIFEEMQEVMTYDCPLPMNKQRGAKAKPAYFTGIINMLVANGLKGENCNYDPKKLTTITRDEVAIRTLSRRVDGAFPGTVNPVAVWEIKEYYYTTTFGSRIADGVYETLVDGMELEELREHEGIDVKHYLMVDAYDTWWKMGRSYLCRMVDMLHMGYVDEVLFGREVVDRIPELTSKWLALLKSRSF